MYAVDPEFGSAHPGWLLYRSDGEPQRLGDLLQITDPANADWQQHWLITYGGAADALGFDGFHLDTYGYRRDLFADGADTTWVDVGDENGAVSVRWTAPAAEAPGRNPRRRSRHSARGSRR